MQRCGDEWGEMRGAALQGWLRGALALTTYNPVDGGYQCVQLFFSGMVRLGNLHDRDANAFLDFAQFFNVRVVLRLVLGHVSLMFGHGTEEVLDPGEAFFGCHGNFHNLDPEKPHPF